MSLQSITVEDCLDNYYKKRKITILSNGQVIGFQKEIPAQAGNRSRDNE